MQFPLLLLGQGVLREQSPCTGPLPLTSPQGSHPALPPTPFTKCCLKHSPEELLGSVLGQLMGCAGCQAGYRQDGRLLLGMAGYPSAGGHCQQRFACSPPPSSWGWRLSKMLIEAGCWGTSGWITLLWVLTSNLSSDLVGAQCHPQTVH